MSAMSARKNVLGFIDASRKVRRPPLVGMQFLHEHAMRAPNGIGIRASLQAKDLMSLLRRHFIVSHRQAPRCRVSLRVFTPAGIPAVTISHQ
jgi:hypothetical protein